MVTAAKGKFSFTTTEGGEYRVCAKAESEHWFGGAKHVRFGMRVDVGEHAIDYEEVAKHEHLSGLQRLLFFFSSLFFLIFSFLCSSRWSWWLRVCSIVDFSGLEVELRMLTNKLETVRAEQRYQWKREREFRNTSESTYERILWWNVGQSALLVLAALYQAMHLKRFLKSKKLV